MCPLPDLLSGPFLLLFIFCSAPAAAVDDAAVIPDAAYGDVLVLPSEEDEEEDCKCKRHTGRLQLWTQSCLGGFVNVRDAFKRT
jgi:hypothetical protein